VPSTLNPNDGLKKVIQTTLDELEAGLISERTNAALKAAKARGVRLGRHGAEVLAPKFKEEARQRAKDLKPVVTELKGRGLSLAKIAGELNKRKLPTPRGAGGITRRCEMCSSASQLEHQAAWALTVRLGAGQVALGQKRKLCGRATMSASCQ